MSSIVPYTKRQLVQRIRKHLSNGFPTDSYSISTNELSLYIDQSVARLIRLTAYDTAKVEGVLMVSEAFLVTFSFPAGLMQDPVSGYWFLQLPAPPISLPLGYSITRVYFATSQNGQSQDLWPLDAKRRAYRNLMASPSGARYWVEGSILWVQQNSNFYLGAIPIYVQMPYARTDNMDTPMNVPDDIIEQIFESTTNWLVKRLQNPKDIIADDLPAGRTNINTPGT
jgi:hypothetical protein